MSAVMTLRNKVRSSIRRALRGNEVAHAREVERAALRLRFSMPWGHWSGNSEAEGRTLPRCGK
jgi:hypothetical protein